MQYHLLDLFCCEGLAADGYRSADFQITGVDNKPQPNYPYAFVLSDALEYLALYGHLFDGIHASPPCQWNSRLKAFYTGTEQNLLHETHYLLLQSGKPFIMENVPGATLPGRLRLHGKMFGLQTIKERWFWSNIWIPEPAYNRQYKKPGDLTVVANGYNRLQDGKAAMGVPADRTVSRSGLSNGIPPAYTKYLGSYLLQHIIASKSKQSSLPGHGGILLQ